MVVRFFKFLLAGGLSALCNWSSRFLFSVWFPFEIAVAMAFVVGIITAFLLMRKYVFGAGIKSIGQQFATFVMINMGSLVLTLIVSSLLARWVLPALGVRQYVEAISHFVGIAATVVFSYSGHSRHTFKD